MSTNSPKGVDDQEIDLSALSRGIGRGVDRLNAFIFDCIQFVVKNIIVFVILLVVGVALGIYLDRTQKTYEHEVIVSPNFGAADYLYSKIDLIDSKLKENDTVFLSSIGLGKRSKLMSIKIEPIIDVYRFVNGEKNNFEMLKLMSEDGDIKKVLEDKATSKNYQYHLISYSTRSITTKERTLQPIMDFLNNSDFFTKIQREYVGNVKMKMAANDTTIVQINRLLSELARTKSGGASNSVYINENTQLNDVIKTKDELVRDQGHHRIELVSLDKIIKDRSSVLNIENNRSVNGKMKIVLPILFFGIFVMYKLFRNFYRKQSLKRAS